MLIDILFTIGTAGFLIADFKQFYKLVRQHAGDTNAISRTHLKIKVVSLISVTTGYWLSQLHISTCVSTMQLALTFGILYYTLRGYRNEERR